MVDVELIYDSDCPNAQRARAQLLKAFAETGLEPRWQEWNRSDVKNPDYVRRYGSPTILIDGKDVGDAPPANGKSCRVYTDNNGKFSGVPSQRAIVEAIIKAQKKSPASASRARRHKSQWLGSLGTIPAIGAALLPGIACPACWPAYAGLLSLAGLGFVNYTPYLLPLTLVFLGVAILFLGLSARQNRSLGPFILGSAGALIIIVGKFILVWKAATYGGITFLIAASVWNLWLRKTSGGASCPGCVPAAAPRKELQHRQPEKGD